ncbi:MAG: hypothetical protein H0T89_10795 [Deltaproteobacteria bacterium]|nr:hypothetical protein [Deltaproteobacteria bacterium]
MRTFVKLAVGLLAVWLVALVILGYAFAGRTGSRVADRLGESLQATSTIGDTTLGLVRGKLVLERLALRRDDLVGNLALDIGEVTCDLPPLGLALVDRECSELVVDHMRLTVSAAALFRLERPKRKPFHAGHVVIDDAELEFSPSAFLPGLGRMKIRIEHAEAGPTTFRTPLSWLFALEKLQASIELPAGFTLRLTYAEGKLRASGSLFGSTPVEVPFTIPVASTAADAKGELHELAAMARAAAEQLVAQRAADWLRSKIP